MDRQQNLIDLMTAYYLTQNDVQGQELNDLPFRESLARLVKVSELHTDLVALSSQVRHSKGFCHIQCHIRNCLLAESGMLPISGTLQ